MGMGKTSVCMERLITYLFCNINVVDSSGIESLAGGKLAWEKS